VVSTGRGPADPEIPGPPSKETDSGPASPADTDSGPLAAVYIDLTGGYSGLADPTATGIPLELPGALSGSDESGPVPSVSAFQLLPPPPPPPPLSGTLWSL